MRPILLLLIVSYVVGLRSHKSGKELSYRVLIGASMLCVVALYSQRLI